jgi:glutathione peroxidase
MPSPIRHRHGMRIVAAVLAVTAALLLAGCGEGSDGSAGPARTAPPVRAPRAPAASPGRAERIDGTSEPLTTYRGRVVLVVNTASRCGNTPQYAGLERLYRERSGDGLVVLGFPSNDFGGQEPGADADIAEFCRLNYGVSFPMFAKTPVTGEAAHPLFRALTARSEAPDWNFAKYLIDREGRLVRRFSAYTPPDDPLLVRSVEALLAEGAPA